MVMGANCEHICIRLTITYRQYKTNSMSLLNKHAIYLCVATINQGMSPDVEILSNTFVKQLLVLTRTHARTHPRDGSGKDNHD